MEGTLARDGDHKYVKIGEGAGAEPKPQIRTGQRAKLRTIFNDSLPPKHYLLGGVCVLSTTFS
jgi:hypothetical protein